LEVNDTIIVNGEVYDCAKYYKGHFGVSDMTWNRWRKQNKLPDPLKIGNRLYYPRLNTEEALITQP
jgi:hypothetical protein